MAEASATGTYEEKPKINWFLFVASGFFGVLILALIDLPSSLGKWLWLGIAILNLGANLMQINFTRNIRYVLWKRGLSIYLGKNREALIRFDRTLLFKAYKSYGDAKKDLREFQVTMPLRSLPVFGGRRRWFVIFEREDDRRQGIVFDPSPQLEMMFRKNLMAAEDAMEVAELPPAEVEPEWEVQTPPEEEEPKPPGGQPPGQF
jgi:hypothetical protein